MKLPTYEEATEAYELDLATPLDKFVKHYEPSLTEDAASVWRYELKELITYVLENAICYESTDVEGQQFLPLDDEQE